MPGSVLQSALQPISLPLHPATPSLVGDALTVDVGLNPTGIELYYRFRGDPATLRLPAPQAAGQTDELWRHTCCEAFVASAPSAPSAHSSHSPAYLEFNFSPSGQWAIYRFTDYRQRDDSDSPFTSLPPIGFSPRPDGFDLRATMPRALLPPGPWQLGLAAVIERAAGNKEYWALAHASEQADFHLRQTFILQLPPP